MTGTGTRIVVIGASAGGVEALIQLVQKLPSNLAASVFIVVHFPAFGISFLPNILTRLQSLPAAHPRDGDRFQPGRIYIAPPDFHLLLHRGYLELSRGPRENGHRPAIDALFRTAAETYGPAVVGVVLSGMLDDGTTGLRSIKAVGGIALVQDPEEAMFKGMPTSAIANVNVDQVLPLSSLANELARLIDNGTGGLPMTPDNIEPDETILAEEKTAAENGHRPNAASPLTCPDCGGVLWELHDGGLLKFRCHIGHSYSLDSLFTEQAEDLERALWTGVRAIEEKAALSRRLATHAREQNRPKSAEQFLERAEEAKKNAQLLRQIILQQKGIRKVENPSSGFSDVEGLSQ